MMANKTQSPVQCPSCGEAKLDIQLDLVDMADEYTVYLYFLCQNCGKEFAQVFESRSYQKLEQQG